MHPADRPRVLEAFRRLNAAEAPLDIEYRVVLRDGRTRHLHHIAQVVRAADGRVEKQIGTIHDITDRHHAEDEARQLQERLTHFSRLSTMGEMAAGLAHEINQPLSAIATYSQACQRLLRQAEPDIPDVISALEQVNAQALRAGEVIRRLRNFVKNREVKREWVNCERLLEDLRTLAETDARLHNVRLQARRGRGPAGRSRRRDPVAAGGAEPGSQLHRRHGRVPGGPQGDRAEGLQPRRRPGPDHGRRPGCGLAPGADEHLFNPFFTTKASGTGLGLAISHSIIRAHGGRLWHTSNEAMRRVLSFHAAGGFDNERGLTCDQGNQAHGVRS